MLKTLAWQGFYALPSLFTYFLINFKFRIMIQKGFLIMTTSIVVLLFNLNAFGQTITLAETSGSNSCNINGRVFTKTSTSGGRNIFTGTISDGAGGFVNGTIQYSGSQWQLTVTGLGLIAHIANTSTPNPPIGNAWTDDFGCGTVSVASVLSAELTQFDVQNTEGSKNHLTWRTESEKNNSHFDIERSTDGTTFHNIGQVKGNNKPSSYQFVDNQPFAISYYRLRQIDFDGKETLSKVISIATKSNGKGLKVHPNPVSNVLTVEYTEGSLFQVLNLLGQQVLVGKTTQQLDVSALPQGTYVLKVGTEVAKFVKQ
jgi:hypothetical protein